MFDLRRHKRGLLIICLLAISLLLSGCRALTMAGYESAMQEILKQAKADLETAGMGASSNPTAPTPDDKKVVEALEKIGNELKKVTPPDDLFSGHSDIREFIELTIKSRQEQPKPSKSGKGQPPQPPMNFTLFNASRQALDRARREMPFLEYELSEAFSGVLRPTFSPGPSGGLGAPGGFSMPPGMTMPGSQPPQSPMKMPPSGSPIKISPPSQAKTPGQ